MNVFFYGYLAWKERSVLEVLEECAGEESSKEENDGKEEDVGDVVAGVGEDAHEPAQGDRGVGTHSLQCLRPSLS